MSDKALIRRQLKIGYKARSQINFITDPPGSKTKAVCLIFKTVLKRKAIIKSLTWFKYQALETTKI